MRILLSLCLIAFFTISLSATPTTIIIRAKAKDAKFIGSSVGGAYVVVSNQMTRAILTQGKTSGGTGNTSRIMKETRERYTALADENTSQFVAVVDIDEPTLLHISVTAPVNQRQAAIEATTEVWAIPGKDILGDGVVLEIPGFIIDVLAPRTHQFINAGDLADGLLPIEANVVMMCGCTISDGGLWDANKMDVKVIVKRNGELVEEVLLQIDSPNLFKGAVAAKEGGLYEIVVYAYDAATGNTGVDKVNVVVE